MASDIEKGLDRMFDDYVASNGALKSRKDVVAWFGNRGDFVSPRSIKLWSWNAGNLYIIKDDTDEREVDVYRTCSICVELEESIPIEKYSQLPHVMAKKL